MTFVGSLPATLLPGQPPISVGSALPQASSLEGANGQNVGLRGHRHSRHRLIWLEDSGVSEGGDRPQSSPQAGSRPRGPSPSGHPGTSHLEDRAVSHSGTPSASQMSGTCKTPPVKPHRGSCLFQSLLTAGKTIPKLCSPQDSEMLAPEDRAGVRCLQASPEGLAAAEMARADKGEGTKADSQQEVPPSFVIKTPPVHGVPSAFQALSRHYFT